MIDELHIQMTETDTFCVEMRGQPVAAVRAEAWHDNHEAVQKATCPQCLLKLVMLGDSALCKLKAMGMEVQIRNDDAAEDMAS